LRVSFVIFKFGQTIFDELVDLSFVTVFRETLFDPLDVIEPWFQRIWAFVTVYCGFVFPEMKEVIF